MVNESRVFNFVAAFLYVCAGTYAWWTDKVGELEWAGTIILLLGGTLGAVVGMYFAIVAKRINPRTEDRDAEMAEGAGEIGFFSPGSYWPLGLGLAATLGSVGLAAEQWWLGLFGLIGTLLTTCGLVFEYYLIKNRPAG